MKELSIEEKAKRYDEAIKKLCDFYRDYDTVSHLIDVKEELANLFPELVESEDEKIRKSLIILLQHFCKGYRVPGLEFPVSYKDMLAWLEKQGEHKLPIEKFHEGEWVVFNDKHESVYQIEKIENFQYILRHILGGSMPLSFSHEDMIRVWTVKDAKNGDILQSSNKPFIYNEYLEEGKYPFGYGGINLYGRFGVSNGLLPMTHDEVTPATKEQRDLLFQKMKEAGYEWDSEKKELKKINKNTDVGHEYFSDLLEKDDCDNIDDYAYQCAYCMSHDWMKDTATWDDVERACKLGAEWNERHHNSSWSEEDAVNFNLVYTYVPDDSLRDWLKELKDRVQPQTTWKPSDVQMEALANALSLAKNCGEENAFDLRTLYEQLERLKGE